MDKAFRYYSLDVQGGTEQLPNGDLETLQEAVGGYIEAVTITDNMVMYVNEEGLLQGLPLNVMATGMSGRHIVGNVVVAVEKETSK